MRKGKVALLSLIAIAAMLCGNVNAEGKFKVKFCEYSDDYIRWMNLSEEEREGLIEPVMCKTGSINYVGSAQDATASRYSLKDKGYLLGMRDQKNSESCWAYSSAASIESNMLINGQNAQFISPSHMEILTQNTYKIPNIETYGRTFNGGGSSLVSSAYMFNHWGPVYESDFPETNTFNALANNGLDVNSVPVGAKLDVNTLTIVGDGEQGKCSANTISAIKNYVATKGGLLAQMFWAPLTTIYPDSNAATGNYIGGNFLVGPYYYYDGSAFSTASKTFTANMLPNHGVTVVGWDDSIPASSFAYQSLGKTPSRNGAWIIKNSYGTSVTSNGVTGSLGNDGYFYVSYDDINICSLLAGFSDIDENVSDYAYYYDYMNFNSALQVNGTEYYVANKFNKKTQGGEKLEKVSFATPDANIPYTVYINNVQNPIASGTTKGMGYESVDINSDIVVDDVFYIIVKFQTNILPIAAGDANYTITPDVSFLSVDGQNFSKLSNNNVNYQASVRVYTSSTDKQPNTSGDLNTGGDNIVVENPNPTYTSNPKTGIEDHKEMVLLVVAGLVAFVIISKQSKFRRV